MTQQSLIERAKQGDAEAIATLVNRQLQPKGILAKVAVTRECLQIILESTAVPIQQQLVAYIWNAMSRLEASSIQKVKIYGKQAGNDFPAWHQEFELQNSESAANTHVVSLATQSKPPAVESSVEEGEIQVKCPKCRSAQVTANKKGFNIGQALVGGVFTAGIGIAAGFWGSNEIRLNCLRCGHRWKPE